MAQTNGDLEHSKGTNCLVLELPSIEPGAYKMEGQIRKEDELTKTEAPPAQPEQVTNGEQPEGEQEDGGMYPFPAVVLCGN